MHTIHKIYTRTYIHKYAYTYINTCPYTYIHMHYSIYTYTYIYVTSLNIHFGCIKFVGGH